MRSILAFLIIVVVVQPTRGAPVTTAPAESIDALIQHLEDRDPGARERAGKALLAKGYLARPALIKAARSNSPQISSQATDLLMRLPWWVLRDPDDVRNVLVDYGTNDSAGRISAIAALASTSGGPPAIFRLMTEDPSDTVSWAAFELLRQLEDKGVVRTARAVDLADARVQILTYAGLANLPTDHARGMELFKRAIDLDDGSVGDLDVAYRMLVLDAIEAGNKTHAAELWRLRARRFQAAIDTEAPVFDLMALYADHGLLPDFDKDAQEFSSSLGRPETMYALSHIERMRDGGSSLSAEAIAYCGHAASLGDADSQLRASRFLSDQSWNVEARREVTHLLPLNGEDALQDSRRQLGSEQLLAQIADVEENYQAAAEHDEAVDRLRESDAAQGITWQLAELDSPHDDARAYRLHIAIEAGDTVKAESYLQKLIDLPTPDTECAIEVVAVLDAKSRHEEAKQCFERAFVVCKAKLASPPNRAIALNNVAWLCACCRQHVDEGLAFALRAMALDPENYAYIDTAASAYFAAGKPDEAVRLEKRALLMRPTDPFLLRQLADFQSGKWSYPHFDSPKKD